MSNGWTGHCAREAAGALLPAARRPLRLPAPPSHHYYYRHHVDIIGGAIYLGLHVSLSVAVKIASHSSHLPAAAATTRRRIRQHRSRLRREWPRCQRVRRATCELLGHLKLQRLSPTAYTRAAKIQ